VFWGGIKDVNVKIATFRGDFVFEYGKVDKVARWNGLYKEMIFNSYLLDREHIIEMVKILNKFKPELIKGYPHVLYILSKTIDEENLSLTFSPKIIQTSSEQLPSYMRETIERVFNTKIFDWYSQSEYVISIGECEYDTYHQTMETGIMAVVEDEWDFERLVGTRAWNYSQPFINYMIGDIIKQDIPELCPCGRKLQVVDSIEGRVNDIVVTPSGKAISGVGFDHYVKHRVLCYISATPEYLHFIQTKIDELVVEIYSIRDLPEADINLLISELKLLMGNDAEIKIKYLDKLPKTKKWRVVESKVSGLENTHTS